MASYAKNKQLVRIKDYKKTPDSNDARRKREEKNSQIRKDKRIENLQKKRREATLSEEDTFHFGNIADRLQELDQLVLAVKTGDVATQLDATTRIRKLLSIEKSPPIQDVIDAGVVPFLVGFLKRNDCGQLQFEALWALTNIASGSSEQTHLIIDSGAIHYCRELMFSINEEVREQAVWALGNIAGDSPQCRNLVLQYQIMDGLLKNLTESTKISMLRNATWTLSNMCRGKPQPSWDYIQPALPIIRKLIYSTDEEVLTDACWALSYLTDGTNDSIQAVIDSGVSKRMVELLLHQSFSVQTPALRTIGNIVTGDDTQTQSIINQGVLPCLLALLSSAKKGIRKEACWTISNITAGNNAQIQAVIDSQLVPKLLSLLKSNEYEVKKEAAWAISNATSGGTPDQIKLLVDQHIIEPFCDLLLNHDHRIVMVALEALENILKGGNDSLTGQNMYSTAIEECGGLDYLDRLQNHQNSDVYERAVNILEMYFAAEEEDQNATPNINTTANTYQFGISNTGHYSF